jgi:hypothetical protein
MAGGIWGGGTACLSKSLRSSPLHGSGTQVDKPCYTAQRSSSLTLLRYMGRWNRGFVKKLAFLAAARLQYASGQAPLVPFTFLGLRPAVRKLVKSPGDGSVPPCGTALPGVPRAVRPCGTHLTRVVARRLLII